MKLTQVLITITFFVGIGHAFVMPAVVKLQDLEERDAALGKRGPSARELCTSSVPDSSC
jgi:hypothetical protein